MVKPEPHDGSDEIETIAIIGLGARFPGAGNIVEFWQNLCRGVESVAFFSEEELLKAGVTLTQINLPNYVKAAPILKDIDQFDAGFFNIPPSEAAFMDPQHRFFLVCAWEALEDAGYDPATYPGWIGVFGGAGWSSYLFDRLLPLRHQFKTPGGSEVLQVSLANKSDFLTTRVSYKLNLKGASFNVQTACSTALVAVHLACQSLLSFQCDMALAGGVSIGDPVGYECQEGFLSPDGHIRPFDAEARGTIFGSGVGIVVLKRLSDALKDGDQIYAVIRGSAINNDGSSKVGFTAPSVEGQLDVLAMAYAAADIDPATISYIEAHGTGTPLGDPIEIEALTQAFRAHTDKKQFCAIGAVKGNIGHTDTAAGAAALIKTALALKHRLLPPSINFKTPNPKIDFANSPFFVNTELREWKTDAQVRRAGVSAFGMGGTNAHAVVEQAPEVEPSGPSRRCQLLALSARTETALERMTDNLAEHLQAHPDVNLGDVAYTLHVGRHAFDKRRVVVRENAADASAALRERDPKWVLTGTQVQPERGVVFMFSGQGAQYVNMGRDLYQCEALFREQVDRCAELLHSHLGLDLREVLYPAGANVEGAAGKLDQTWLTQPALFVIEYALAKVWMSWGIKPQAMIGHSIGEYVAACLAGVFGLEDALALVAARGRLMQSMPRGSMLSVTLSEKDVQSFLNSSLVVATVNEPSGCVIAGSTEAVAELEQRLTERGVGSRRLHTSHAFHSQMMEPILGPFEECVSRVQLRAPQVPYLSNVTGAWITPEQATEPAYWTRHLRQAVRFSDGVSALAQTPDQVLLEVGPGNTLRTLAQRHPDRAPEQIVLASMRHPHENQADDSVLLQTLGQLWLSGVSVDWHAFYCDERRLRVSLPTYPFDTQRYWVDAKEDTTSRLAPLFKNPNVAEWFYIPSWKRTMPPTCAPQATKGRWLLFSSGDGLSVRLARQLEARGHPVVTVLSGKEFTANGNEYALHPAHGKDYDALFASLAKHGQTPTHIVHLWNVTPLDETAADFTDKALQHSFYSLLCLAQAISRRDLDDLELVVVSSDVQQVTGGEVIHPEKATLLGPCKVIPQEMPKVACRSIDILLPEAGSHQEAQLVQQLIAELEVNSQDTILAYRGNNRWAQTYELAPLPEVKEAMEDRLREHGVYLIVGGLGGIGLELADYLARVVQAKLVLTSRSRFPRREIWEQYLATRDPRDRTGLAIRAVQSLEAQGAEVLVVQADAANRVQMEAAVRAACDRFGTIHGVIHAAGLPGGGVIQLKTEEVAASVLAPKVQGTRVLEAVLRDIPLDFLMLCSSVAALTGGVGQVDYCAANVFMDAYAQARNRRGGTMVVSINWDAWGRVGMAVNTPPNYAASRAVQAPVKTVVDHPLLHSSYQETNERTVYQVEMNPAEHWVLSEHVLLGIPTVPGTTYLEMARAAFTDRTHSSQLAIREATFLVPLRVGAGDSKETRLILDKRADGFDFQVMSKAGVAANGEAQWQVHVVGQLGPLAEPTLPHCDLQAIRSRCNVSEAVVTGEDIKRGGMVGGFLKFGPRWYNTIKRIYIGHDEGLALLELDEAFSSDVEIFKLHPSLLDVATSFSVGGVDGGRYLPLSYKLARIYGSLPRKFYSYVRRKPGSAADGETITFQITLIDEQGRGLVEIAEFTMKRVGETATSRLRGSEEEPPKMIEGMPGSDGRLQRDLGPAILPEEGVEAFRRILFRNRLPQIVVCTRHLPTLIQQAKESTPDSLLEGVARAETPAAKHARPNLQTPYAAPRNNTETKLAAIWQEVLGVEKVGIRDNFFELGGDSVMGMQVVARIRAAGFQVSAEQIFQNQTVAELATALQPTATQQEAALSLTPYQQHWLAQDTHTPHLLVLEPTQRLAPALLEQALQSICAQHDALRLQFVQHEDGWCQVFKEQSQPARIVTVDLSGFPPEERKDAVRAEMLRLRRGFGVAEPPLLRATYLQAGVDESDCLLLAVSPLSADEAALPILLEDLFTAYQHAASGGEEQLLSPTTTFVEWVRRMTAYSQADQIQGQKDYWQQVAGEQFELLSEGERSGVSQTLRERLTVEKTRELQEVSESYRIEMGEVILAALAQVMSEWSGNKRFLVELCDYQRGIVLGDLDTTRTVGGLRVDYPLCLEMPETEDVDGLLRRVKEQVRQVPERGLGYNHLRAVDESLMLRPPIAFTCCPPLMDSTLFHVAEVDIVEAGVEEQIHLRADIINEQLELDWCYDPGLYCRDTMAALSDNLVKVLQTLVEHCRESDGIGFTPADFPDADLDQAALDRFIAKLGRRG